MSVVVRDKGVIKMYIKGADSLIIDRIDNDHEQPYEEQINKQVDEYSRKGLRTLVIAMKIFSEEEW